MDTSKRVTYEYEHRAGYGRDDHMAEELIARAARQLGLDTSDRIAQCIGLASHPVPMGTSTVRLAAGRGVRQRMSRALRAAHEEIGHYVDVRIDVVRIRTRTEYETRTVRIEDRAGHYTPDWSLREPPSRWETRSVPVRRVREQWMGRDRGWVPTDIEQVQS